MKNMLYEAEKLLIDNLNINYDVFMENLRQDYSQTENIYLKIKSVLNQRSLQTQLQAQIEEISLAGILNTVEMIDLAQSRRHHSRP